MDDVTCRLTKIKMKVQKGFVLLTTLILLGGLVITGAALLTMVDYNFVDASRHRDEVQAFYLAETAAEEAIWYLKNVDSAWVGDDPTEHVAPGGSYTIAVDQTNAPTFVISATGYVPNLSNANAIKVIKLTGNIL